MVMLLIIIILHYPVHLGIIRILPLNQVLMMFVVFMEDPATSELRPFTLYPAAEAAVPLR